MPAKARDRDGDNDNAPVHSSRLKAALTDALDFLGEDTIRYVFFDFEQNGIALDESRYYSLKRMEEGLSNLFGRDGSTMVMQRLRSFLEKGRTS